MSRRWLLRTDALTCWKPYVLFTLFLLFLSINKNLAATTAGWSGNEPRAMNNCYIYLQFVTCLFIVSITANVFEETFRPESYQYIRTFPLGTIRVIVLRYLRVALSVLVPYVPVVLIMFAHANESIGEYLVMFPDTGAFPFINPLIPLVHCVISVNFYIIATMFLLLLVRRKVIALILILAYCALEATMLHFIFPQYVVFRGAFNTPDFYHIFPSNIIILFVASLLMFTIIVCFYRCDGKRLGPCR